MLFARSMLEDEETIRVCAWCEDESGQMQGDRTLMSHTFCRRHAIEYALQSGYVDLASKVKCKPDDAFAPDLAEHPELVRRSGRQLTAP